jgi:hypothetical protein
MLNDIRAMTAALKDDTQFINDNLVSLCSKMNSRETGLCSAASYFCISCC